MRTSEALISAAFGIHSALAPGHLVNRLVFDHDNTFLDNIGFFLKFGSGYCKKRCVQLLEYTLFYQSDAERVLVALPDGILTLAELLKPSSPATIETTLQCYLKLCLTPCASLRKNCGTINIEKIMLPLMQPQNSPVIRIRACLILIFWSNHGLYNLKEDIIKYKIIPILVHFMKHDKSLLSRTESAMALGVLISSDKECCSTMQ